MNIEDVQYEDEKFKSAIEEIINTGLNYGKAAEKFNITKDDIYNKMQGIYCVKI